MRIVHYVNQFFAGLGGEEAAGVEPQRIDGPVGPGRLLQQLLGDDHEVVATLTCGDDHAASSSEASSALLALARDADAELIVAGPAFGSGRYGLACARLVAAAAADGLPAVAAMHPDNPGVDAAGDAPVIAAGPTASRMRPSMERLAPAVAKLAGGTPLTAEDGRVDPAPRALRSAATNAAERAVALLLRRVGGDRDATEIPATGFDTVAPAGPVTDVTAATVALATEGGVVPAGNPDRLESARATRWLRYSLDGLTALAAGDWESVDGGFSTVAVNADPNRMLPLDALRQVEDEGGIGRLHDAYLVTTGNGTPVVTARQFGVEWAADLHRTGVQAAILTGT